MSLTDDEVGAGDFKEIVEKDYQQIKNRVTKLGYANGLSCGRESVFQHGFDTGYAEGLRTCFEIEKYRKFFLNLNVEKAEEGTTLRDERNRFEELQLPICRSTDHFQYTHYKNNNLSYISQKQQEYIKEMVGRLEKNFPQASLLLKTQQCTSLL